jgi:methyl-accepting chemotaxis protein
MRGSVALTRVLNHDNGWIGDSMFLKKRKSLTRQLTERAHAAENDLAAMHRHLATIEFSPDGTILGSSEQFNRVMGIQGDQIKSSHHRQFCSRDYAESNDYRMFWKRVADGESFSGQFPRLRGDGAPVWLEATYFPVRDEIGQVIKVIKIAADITAQKDDLDTRNAMFDAINKSMAVIHFDPHGNILDANDNFLASVGFSLNEIRGRHHRMFCDDAFYEANPDFWSELSAGRFKSGKYKRIHKQGNEVWLEATYNPIFDASGAVVKVIKFSTDVTASVNREMAIRHTADMAGSTSEQTSQIVMLGVDRLKDTVRSTAQMTTKIADAHEQAEALTAYARNIDDIVSTIGAISEQTNLLALNAAIEAARAGEYGRGFAVVADEVRSLASRTSHSTKEIAGVIKSTQDIVEQMMQIITDVNNQANSVNASIADVERNMSEIKTGADNVVSQITRVIEAA